MKKKTKIIVIILSSTIILVGILLLLIFNTNLFLDSSDLVCTINTSDGELEEEEIVTFCFDYKGIVKEYEESYIIKFDNEQTAQEYFNETLKNNPTMKEKLNINGTQVVFNVVFKVNDSTNKFYNKTKKEMKNIYKNEYFYKCE